MSAVLTKLTGSRSNVLLGWSFIFSTSCVKWRVEGVVVEGCGDGEVITLVLGGDTATGGMASLFPATGGSSR